MASVEQIASDWFNVVVEPDVGHDECLTAQDAECYHSKSADKLEAATAMLQELLYSLDHAHHTTAMTRHYISAVMGLLFMSNATANAVDQFIAAQLKKEWTENQQACSADTTPPFATAPAGHA